MSRAAWESLQRAAESCCDERIREDVWLIDCLRRNAETEYGRKYDFAHIHNEKEYRTMLPMVTYEDLEPEIQRIFRGEHNVLFAGSPIAFERTGGSSGGAKLIPYSPESLKDFRRALLPWLGSLVDSYSLSGSAYMAISPATRALESSSSGIPVGLPDGAYLGRDVSDAFAALSAVPLSVGAISSFEDWQLATLYYLIRADNLEMISVWSPTFMLVLLDSITIRRHELTRLFQRGGAVGGRNVQPCALSSARLDAYDGLNTTALWPHLKLLSCWTDGSSAAYAERLAEYMPQSRMQGKGLLLTEGAVTVPDAAGFPVPVRGSGYFEFLDDAGRSRTSTELEPGASYETVLTTSGGLYRYRAGDVVRCCGHSGGFPVLRFLGRCGVFSDLVGEKLSDAFAADCLARVGRQGVLMPSPQAAGYLLIADNEWEPSDLLRMEEALCRNPQYAYARKVGQLAALRFLRVPDMVSRFAESSVKKGRLVGDIKMPALCKDCNWLKEVLP